VRRRGVPTVLWVCFLSLVVATLVDLRRREIPDSIPIALLGLAIAATAFGVAAEGWLSLAIGLALGLAIGACLVWAGGFGGGDAKLLAAVGAVLGPRAFLTFLFYAAIAGGVLAAIALMRGKRDIAYAPALALGFFAFMWTRGAL
jgi:prepilin peptidase CpaA